MVGSVVRSRVATSSMLRPLSCSSLAFLFLAAIAVTARPEVRFPPLIRPDIVEQRSGLALAFPPTTDYCESHFHVACYQPFQLQRAYHISPLLSRGVDGRGTTIAIVDAFGSPSIAHDLQTFDEAFGLPAPPSLTVIQPAGPVPPFPQDPFGASDRLGWAEETSLDVEWSHVMAPSANILVVATPQSETEGTQGFPQIVTAERYVIDRGLADVISQSFGATEETFPNPRDILDLRAAYVDALRNRITVLASAGDTGATDPRADGTCCYAYAVNSWPSSDPLVTSVGGTQLHLDLQGRRTASDTVWDGTGATGGGLSAVFARPSFQDGVRSLVGSQRGTPDISMSAAVNGGVDVFSSFTGRPEWHVVGGTSEASPLFAGVVALADQVARRRLGWLNPDLYLLGAEHATGIVDVTRGNNSFSFCWASCNGAHHVEVTVPGYSALIGYDLASGVGTVNAAELVPELARMASTPPRSSHAVLPIPIVAR
jgi:subtilase family serine protease